MKEFRSASQILFGFLPEQTVDLAGRVWKVREWRHPIRKYVDETTLRQELLRLSGPWEAAGTDNGFGKHLRQGRELEIHSLDINNGVVADSFPDMWMCKACFRLHSTMVDACQCGAGKFGQLPFVAYHECGALLTPSIPRCQAHGQVRVVLPGTSSAAELRFICPVCAVQLQRGFGFSRCRCGAGTALKYNVHRASSVYTPRSVVVVNPPSPERVRRLADAGGPDRALTWVLDGLVERRFDDVGATRDSLLRDLRGRGLPDEFIERMLRQAEAEGALAASSGHANLPQPAQEDAARAAVTLAMALDESRVTVANLSASSDGTWNELASLYRTTYPSEFRRAGLDAVELIDKFPILTGNFGYTRGDPTPGQATLKPFMIRNAKYVVYADVAETEGLLFRLRPTLVAQWLVSRGFHLGPWNDERSARLAILGTIDIPPPGAPRSVRLTAGEAVLELVHSFAHRMIRRASVFAGIDRNALSELLVPHHLAFIVYAAARGDFVLGGLQAVFESELHSLLRDVVLGDHRCALDPGCRKAGGACMACLHVGEPSCRYYNQFLNRDALFGSSGYLQLAVNAQHH